MLATCHIKYRRFISIFTSNNEWLVTHITAQLTEMSINKTQKFILKIPSEDSIEL